jgi:hypothetical protein
LWTNGHASLNGAVFDRPLSPVDFQGLARSVLLREWQGKWDGADTGRFAHFILPGVSLRPWFEGGQEICFICLENNSWSLITLE